MGSFAFFNDFDQESSLDQYIDLLQDLLEAGKYDAARDLSDQINSISGVSSSADRASAF